MAAVLLYLYVFYIQICFYFIVLFLVSIMIPVSADTPISTAHTAALTESPVFGETTDGFMSEAATGWILTEFASDDAPFA